MMIWWVVWAIIPDLFFRHHSLSLLENKRKMISFSKRGSLLTGPAIWRILDNKVAMHRYSVTDCGLSAYKNPLKMDFEKQSE